jgi:hypothetical protein
MILIDQPFASDFLIKTIKENNFQIIETSIAKEMIDDCSLNWISENEAIDIYKNRADFPIYTNSENAIGWIEKNLPFSELPAKIQLFKNKIAFRELIKDAFPNYFFKGVKFEDLKTITEASIQFPLIIKPAVGFFSLAVYKMDNWEEWASTQPKIKTEIDSFKKMYPKEVVDATSFILEAYIEGEEHAIDCYFNEKGEVVILNILHHIFSSDKDVSDRVYSTSKEIFEMYYAEIEQFLQLIGKKADLKNFPMHVEIRIDKNKNIIPIEINPLRFGGWCTTGDISWFAFGINSYEYFLQNKKPDWKTVFNNRQTNKYNLIVLDNNSGIKESAIESFNYELLLKDFKKPLNLRKVDYKKYRVFGFLFTETSIENNTELKYILTSDLKKYIILRK